jgi:hypothetical protein
VTHKADAQLHHKGENVMPQTSSEVQAVIDKWFPFDDATQPKHSQDFAVMRVLRSKGWTEKAGMWYPPTPSYYGPREDYILLKYLVEEWDYAYTTPPLV